MVGPVTYQPVYGYVRTDEDRFNDGNIEKFNHENITIPVIDGDVTETMVKNKFSKAKPLKNNSGWEPQVKDVQGENWKDLVNCF